MAVATKRRRKITVADRRYIWFVCEDDEGMVLHVVSADKKFIAQYQLVQPKGVEYIVILGRRFAGAKTGGPWKRFRCPRFATPAVTPGAVRQLIEWCLDENLKRQEVDWRCPLGL